ncbi:MAG: hypothetical protein K2M15_06680 [Oscillospiraceae bacterium]|nr:hypothetical protein [Oscillospiraceae bacterium]
MWNRKNYRLGFDHWGLGLFLLIMLPNFIWFAFPAPNDVLRSESATPTVDFVAQVFQIAIAAALCAVVNVTRDKPMKRGYLAGIAACVGLYLAGWAAYYAGIVNAAVILDLCLAPCGAFLIFALGRKNAIALVSAAAFAVGHLIFAVVNFLI